MFKVLSSSIHRTRFRKPTQLDLALHRVLNSVKTSSHDFNPRFFCSDVAKKTETERQGDDESKFNVKDRFLTLARSSTFGAFISQILRHVGLSVGSSGSKTPALDKYGTNLTKLAEEGKLNRVVGRHYEIKRVTRDLCLRKNSNPCLIGEPGVGKTTVVEGLAQLIANGKVPGRLKGKKVISLDMGLLIAGTKFGIEFEERISRLVLEVRQSDDIILFVDELHTLFRVGTSEGIIGAANILKSALDRGKLQCIGATTPVEYRKHIEEVPTWNRRFQPVKVPEPSVDETVQILKGLRERYKIHHKLCYTDESIVAAAQLSSRYISDGFLPEKAIDLIDKAGFLVHSRYTQTLEEAKDLEEEMRKIIKEKMEAVRDQDFEKAIELRDREKNLQLQISILINKNKRESKAESKFWDDTLVTKSDIRSTVFSWTGIPVELVSNNESRCLVNLEETLHRHVIGQDEAVNAVSNVIRCAQFNLINSNKLIASFIFAGPIGVGKSELAKALAIYYFGSKEAMVRLDMNGFMDSNAISKLIGSPREYVGYTEVGRLTEAVRCCPYTVVLFDEIEKAHPDVLSKISDILENGWLIDSQGRTVNCKNTLFIMTSNIGSSIIEKGGCHVDYDDHRVLSQLEQHFRPRFLDLLDEMIVFRHLSKLEVKELPQNFGIKLQF